MLCYLLKFNRLDPDPDLACTRLRFSVSYWHGIQAEVIGSCRVEETDSKSLPRVKVQGKDMQVINGILVLKANSLPSRQDILAFLRDYEEGSEMRPFVIQRSERIFQAGWFGENHQAELWGEFDSFGEALTHIESRII